VVEYWATYCTPYVLQSRRTGNKTAWEFKATILHFRLCALQELHPTLWKRLAHEVICISREGCNLLLDGTGTTTQYDEREAFNNNCHTFIEIQLKIRQAKQALVLALHNWHQFDSKVLYIKYSFTCIRSSAEFQQLPNNVEWVESLCQFFLPICPWPLYWEEVHFALFVSKRKLENSYVPVTILSSVRSIKHMMDSLCKWITNLFINFNSLQSTLDNDYSFSFSGIVEHVANFRADNKAILLKLCSQPCIHFGAVSLIPSSLQETDCEIKLHKV